MAAITNRSGKAKLKTIMRHSSAPVGKARPAAKGRSAVWPFLPPAGDVRVKAAIYVLLILFSAIVVSYGVTIRIMDSHIREEIIRRAESLSRSLASAAGYHLILKDLLALDNLVFKVKSTNPDMTSISVVGPEDEIIVHSDAGRRGQQMRRDDINLVTTRLEDGTLMREKLSPRGSSFLVESPVAFMDKKLGSVILEVDWSSLTESKSSARKKIIGFFAVILILGIAGSIVLSSRMTRPIKELTAGVEEIKKGKRSNPLRVYSHDELGRLTASFNEMTALITDQREKLSNYARDLEEAYVSTVRVLAAAIEARDKYTLGHSTRVAGHAISLGRAVGLKENEIEDIEIACLFHDVGKIRIPDSILHKTGLLDPDEMAEMRKHAEYGAEILSKAPSLYKYIPAVRHHHEWYDGSGYPDGLKGDEIPASAAIISLADAFDAMTSDRPYRKALTKAQAMNIIRKNSGRQFNPAFAAAFLKIVAKENVPKK